MDTDHQNYPRLAARTMKFTLGVPRSFAVSPDGQRVAFLRSGSGTDRVHQLWVLDVASGAERLVADPASLLAADEAEELSPAERARRERLREGAGGIVAYATDHDVRTAAFALSSRLFCTDLEAGSTREIPVPGQVLDPRPDPTGRRIAYVVDSTLRVVNVDGTDDRELAAPSTPGGTVGLAEFIAAEEMNRSRGFWWAPDGESLLAAEVDLRPVQEWHIANPAEPAASPQSVRYPAAGTADAVVTLWHLALDGRRREVVWDRIAFPYLARVTWPRSGAPVMQVQSRDQQVARIFEFDPTVTHSATPSEVPTRLLHEVRDDAWVDLIVGSPTRLGNGQLVTTAAIEDSLRLLIDGRPVSPPDLQVRAVLDTSGDAVLVTASSEPTEIQVLWIDATGSVRPVSKQAGIHAAQWGGGTTVLVSRLLDDVRTKVQVLRDEAEPIEIRSHAMQPPIDPVVRMLRLGDRELRGALLLPSGHVLGSAKLPVLLDPYGGPGAQRVLAAGSAFLEPQWWADQGFAVLVVDGRGTPGRGPRWDRAIRLGFAEATLADQVDALRSAATAVPDLDLDRVAIRGWSFGGYLAALAVLRRPDVFHAAVAGAPVTDWRLYDTHYTERYLGHPDKHPDVYHANSLLADAPRLERPLLLIHGLADDNVVAAHTLRLSQALLEAGRQHQVLPLSGVTHFTPQEVVAENLLRLQLQFLQAALAH